MVRDRKLIRKALVVSVLLLLFAATAGVAGKKHDTAKIAISNVRALVVNLRVQVDALERLIEESASSAETTDAEAADGYAVERNGRLTDLRVKARLLENEANQLQQELREKDAADVLKLSRAVYQETRTLRATIERFPRTPEMSVDDVLVSELMEDVARLDEQTKNMAASYLKKS
ncbi:MAG: hypothetical protein R3344_01060 [Acidobacteriota bacterium]|nr:hypothetical protein [Acidobacteriota bacterium]